MCALLQAFSAVGALQGAWHLATGQTLSLSEQQLVDCSWNYGNNGCQGGEMEPAIQVLLLLPPPSFLCDLIFDVAGRTCTLQLWHAKGVVMAGCLHIIHHYFTDGVQPQPALIISYIFA